MNNEENRNFYKLAIIHSNFRDKLASIKTEPGNIFHYTSAAGLEGILKWNIWFSDIKYLNDSSECDYIYTLIPRCLRDLDLNKDFRKILKSINKYQSDKNFYVASFSKNPDCLELWNYYTKTTNGVGYNIEFSKNCLFMINVYSVQGAIIYSQDIQIELLKEILCQYNEFYLQNNQILKKDHSKKEVFIMNLMTLLELYNLFYKDSAFYNEQEYRVVIYNPDDIPAQTNLIEETLRHRIFNGLFIPYLEIPFNKSNIKSIKISPNNENRLYENGVKSLLISNKLTFIKNISSSKIPKRY